MPSSSVTSNAMPTPLRNTGTSFVSWDVAQVISHWSAPCRANRISALSPKRWRRRTWRLTISLSRLLRLLLTVRTKDWTSVQYLFRKVWLSSFLQCVFLSKSWMTYWLRTKSLLLWEAMMLSANMLSRCLLRLPANCTAPYQRVLLVSWLWIAILMVTSWYHKSRPRNCLSKWLPNVWQYSKPMVPTKVNSLRSTTSSVTKDVALFRPISMLTTATLSA